MAKHIGGKKKKSLIRHLNESIDKKEKIRIVLLPVTREETKELVIKEMLERRANPPSNSGFYIKGTDVQIPLKSIKYNLRPYYNDEENVIVVQTQYSPSTLNSLIKTK